MPKDTVEFPWRHDLGDDSQPVSTPTARAKWREVVYRYRLAIACTAGAALLVWLLAQTKQNQTTPLNPAVTPTTISVMVPVVAFPKGSTIEPSLLKAVLAPTKAFSKTQLLSVFTEEDISRLNDRLVAKKDLVPYRPIFWPSLELRRAAPARAPQVEILYPPAEGNSP